MIKATKIFSYQFDTRGRSFPLIPISVYSSKIRKDFVALIDSGATISIFKTQIADELGIKIESGEKIMMRSISSWVQGYVHTIKFKVANKKFNLRVVFSHDDRASFNILGRSGFFEKFKITFDEAKKSVILE